MTQIDLTPTSYIVLGFIDGRDSATPYELKALVSVSIGNFWSVPHSQLYAEPARLARAGLLAEKRETAGRRRRLYSITGAGRQALAEWRGEPSSDLPELRDLSLLKLFFGAPPEAIATAQREAHERKLADYRALAGADVGDEPRGPWLALAAGIAHEEEWVRFWGSLEDGGS